MDVSTQYPVNDDAPAPLPASAAALPSADASPTTSVVDVDAAYTASVITVRGRQTHDGWGCTGLRVHFWYGGDQCAGGRCGVSRA